MPRRTRRPITKSAPARTGRAAGWATVLGALLTRFLEAGYAGGGGGGTRFLIML